MNKEKDHAFGVSQEVKQRPSEVERAPSLNRDVFGGGFEPSESSRPMTSFDKYMAEDPAGSASVETLSESLSAPSADAVPGPLPHTPPAPLGEVNDAGRNARQMPELDMTKNEGVGEVPMSGSGHPLRKGTGGDVQGGDNLAAGLNFGPQTPPLGGSGSTPLSKQKTGGGNSSAGFSGGGSGGFSGGFSGGGAGGFPGAFPGGMCPLWAELKKPWRKRHPIKFWLGILIVVLGIIPGVIFSVADGVSTKERVAVVNIEGIILDGKEVIKWIEQVQADARVKGVLVRVNSPGGAVTPSQEIYFALKRLSAKKTVVVSMGALAASGGYYVSLPAQRIFAVPSTVTGSIGVKMDLTNVEDLMGKLGIASTSLASGELKDAGSPFKPLKDNERQYFMGVIQDMFDDFLATVVEHRNITAQQLEGFADGRALTGRQAKELGLVDQLGDKNDALLYLYKECGVKPAKGSLMEGPVKPQSIVEKLTEATVNTLLSKGIGMNSGQDTPVFMYR